MPAVSSGRTVVFLLEGKRKAVVSLPSAQQPPSEVQTDTSKKRKRRPLGVRTRHAPLTPPPAVAQPTTATQVDCDQWPHSAAVATVSAAPHLSCPPGALPALPAPLSPPAVAAADTCRASPVLTVSDECSEPQSPVYDYNTPRTEQQPQQSEPDSALQPSAPRPSSPPPGPHIPCEADGCSADEVEWIESRSSPPRPTAVPVSAADGCEGDDVVVLGEEAAAASPAEESSDVVTLLIDGRHERIYKTSQSQSLIAFQPPSPFTASAPMSAAVPSSVSRRRGRQQQLTLTADTSLTAACPPPISSVSGLACVDAAVAGRVPAFFQPRSRAVQQRISGIAGAGSAKKKAAAHSSTNRAANTDSGRSAGKKKAVQPSPSSQRSSAPSPAAAPADGNVRSSDSRSRFGDCPLCGEVCPLAHTARTRWIYTVATARNVFAL